MTAKKGVQAMSKASLISVIVPVYNVEKYVEQCIKSILNKRLRKLMEMLKKLLVVLRF